MKKGSHRSSDKVMGVQKQRCEPKVKQRKGESGRALWLQSIIMYFVKNRRCLGYVRIKRKNGRYNNTNEGIPKVTRLGIFLLNQKTGPVLGVKSSGFQNRLGVLFGLLQEPMFSPFFLGNRQIRFVLCKELGEHTGKPGVFLCIVLLALCSQLHFDAVCSRYGPGGLLAAGHEAQESRQDGQDAPRRIPGVWVVVTHAQAESSVAGEAAIGRHDGDRRRLERVVGRESKNSVVLSVLVWRFWRTSYHVVPLKDVFVIWTSDDVRRRVGGDRLVLLVQAPLGLSGHHS